MQTYTEQRTAKDPHDYVRQLNEKWGTDGYTFEVVSIDSATKTGRKRYTMRVTKR